MAYITKSNYNKILRKIDFKQIGDVAGTIYKKPIYFLSKNEEKYLLVMQTLMKEPEKFVIEFYKPIINEDTFTYVYESAQPPSYHMNKNCERLTATFKNFVIPFEIKARIRERGGDSNAEKEEVLRFRKWFLQHFELFQNDTEGFLRKLDIDWNISRQPNEVESQNSGVKEIENYNLEQLEKDIDNVISAAGRYFVNNPDKQAIIRRFQKLTFLAYLDKEIYNNDTGLSDAELKDFLKNYDEEYKKPAKKLLVEYYRVKYNADLSFEGQLLERLNFKKCSVCEDPNGELNLSLELLDGK
jgi:hypothetical protein